MAPSRTTSRRSIRRSTGSRTTGSLKDGGVEKAGQRRRRYYRLTTAGRKRLSIERSVSDG
jgi:hypothetical protein